MQPGAISRAVCYWPVPAETASTCSDRSLAQPTCSGAPTVVATTARRLHLSRSGSLICRIEGVACPHTYALTCISLAVLAIVNSAFPSYRECSKRRILARASARPCVDSNQQNSQRWSPGDLPTVFTLPECSIPSGSWPTVRLASWTVGDSAWLARYSHLCRRSPRPMYRITCPSRTRLHARSQALAMHRGLMYRIIGHYHFDCLLDPGWLARHLPLACSLCT